MNIGKEQGKRSPIKLGGIQLIRNLGGLNYNLLVCFEQDPTIKDPLDFNIISGLKNNELIGELSDPTIKTREEIKNNWPLQLTSK